MTRICLSHLELFLFSIPTHFFKIVVGINYIPFAVDSSLQTMAVAAFLVPNEPARDNISGFDQYLVKVEQLEVITGLSFESFLNSEAKKAIDSLISDDRDIKDILCRETLLERKSLSPPNNKPIMNTLVPRQKPKEHQPGYNNYRHLCSVVDCCGDTVIRRRNAVNNKKENPQ
jgi:hypothetical protein